MAVGLLEPAVEHVELRLEGADAAAERRWQPRVSTKPTLLWCQGVRSLPVGVR